MIGKRVGLDSLTTSEARRVALAAQGFDRPRPRRVTARDVSALIRRLGLLQIDYVNVVAPAHYIVPFSRLGPYDRRLLDEVVYRRREFIEHWAHEASIVPAEMWPLLHYRRESYRVRPYGAEVLLEEHRDYVDWLIGQVRERGPLGADELPMPDSVTTKAHAWLRAVGSWFGTMPRVVLEAQFGRGAMAIANRRSNFARSYDLAERVIAAEHHERRVTKEEAQRELLNVAARACGVAAAEDLADYFRMKVLEARPRLAELVEGGELRLVHVEGWRRPAFLHREAKLPRKVEARALLAPFDPLVWFRPRILRLFGFEYRFEIFVPAAQRKWGVYVLPFLFGDRLAARVDLKAVRERGELQVLAAFVEEGAGEVEEALAAELRSMSGWLGLDGVRVVSRKGFARRLAKALAR